MADHERPSTDIHFFFDFISPFAWLAFDHVGNLGAKHGRRVHSVPFRLGVVVTKVMGLRPVLETPLKGSYATHGARRLASVMGKRLAAEGAFDPLPPARLAHCLSDNVRERLVGALLEARWSEGRDIGEETELVRIAGDFGVSADAVRGALTGSEGAEKLRAATGDAIANGVFGSPTCMVDGELFWGVDRLWLLDAYLSEAGRYPVLNPERASALGFS